MNEYQRQMFENRVLLYQARQMIGQIATGDEYETNNLAVARALAEIDGMISRLTLRIPDPTPANTNVQRRSGDEPASPSVLQPNDQPPAPGRSL